MDADIYVSRNNLAFKNYYRICDLVKLFKIEVFLVELEKRYINRMWSERIQHTVLMS